MPSVLENNFFKSKLFATIPFFAILAGSCFFAGCKGGDIHADEKLVQAFAEIRVSNQMYGAGSPAAGIARQEILKKFGYTRESFLTELEKIDEDKKMWIPFQKQVVDHLDSTLDPEGFKTRKEEERKQAEAAKSKGKKK